MNKLIIRIKGGLGNQLFSYAAARRLALVNNVELVIDHISGFTKDYEYRRQYALDNFQIPVRKATKFERLEPFGSYRRWILKQQSRRQPFSSRCYLEQEGRDFDRRLLSFKITKTTYLEGYWQSENYFKDIESLIRQDLKILPPEDYQNRAISEKINNCVSVSIHVRWFDKPGVNGIHNLSSDYYHNSLKLIEAQVNNPHYFLFSDNPEAAIEKLNIPSERVTFVSHNQGDSNAYADLWLMSQCRNFITANSTFSWWGAWLGSNKDKIVITPDTQIDGITAWGFDGLIPPEWIKI
jgi:hypothetical protein